MPHSVMLTNMYGGIGGGEICLLHHIRHLHANGVKVTLLLLESGPFEAEARAVGTTVVVDPFSWRGGKLRSALALAVHIFKCWKLIIQCKPDVVCCYTFNDFVITGTAARLACVPVVWRTQGEMVPEHADAVSASWLGNGLPTFCRMIRPVIASTTEAEARGLEALGLGARLIECVHLGTPVRDYVPPPVRKILRFGLFGRLVEWKGQHIFLEALAELKRRGHEFDAIIVGGSAFGDGVAYEKRLNDLIALHKLVGAVQLLGFRRDVQDLMRQCNVVCHCSSVEPFGMVIVEAMMLGRPVIATSVRGPRESVADGEVGYLVTPNSASSLADAMQRMIDDRPTRLRMGVAARNRALQHFSIEVSMSALDNLIEKALSNNY